MDDKDLAIISICIIFCVSLVVVLLTPNSLKVEVINKLSAVWYVLAGGLSGLATGKKLA